MAVYVNVPIETDADALSQDAFDFLEDKTDGEWEPHDGQLDTWQLTANARMAATLRDLASDVPASIFRYFGQLVNIQPIDSVAATATTHWLATDTAGHDIPAGSHVAVTNASGDLVDFTTTVDAIIPVGDDHVDGVPIIATDEGSAANGIGTIETLGLTLLDNYAYIQAVTLEVLPSGGIDAESDEDYLSRLTSNLQLMSPRPILPEDFAVIARNTPGIGRALALDGYDPVANTFGHARMIGISAIDLAGNDVPGDVFNQVIANLTALREVNFLVNKVNPTRTTVDIQYDVTLWPGWDKPDAQTRINAALGLMLNQATWGMPPFGDVAAWISTTVVSLNAVIAEIAKVEGVKTVNQVLMRKGAAAYAAADVALDGAAALANLGAVAGTVH